MIQCVFNERRLKLMNFRLQERFIQEKDFLFKKQLFNSWLNHTKKSKRHRYQIKKFQAKKAYKIKLQFFNRL